MNGNLLCLTQWEVAGMKVSKMKNATYKANESPIELYESKKSTK